MGEYLLYIFLETDKRFGCNRRLLRLLTVYTQEASWQGADLGSLYTLFQLVYIWSVSNARSLPSRNGDGVSAICIVDWRETYRRELVLSLYYGIRIKNSCKKTPYFSSLLLYYISNKIACDFENVFFVRQYLEALKDKSSEGPSYDWKAHSSYKTIL